jgi:pimeloyl-ACP methyl ester carboxylesterase
MHHPVRVNLQETYVDGRPARYAVAGSGDPLVLVHGLAGSLGWWSDVIPRLAAERRVYAVDLPRPTRRAPAMQVSSWLERWLRVVGVERADIGGHSLGGIAAAELAVRRPELVRRLVLVAPAGIPCGPGVAQRLLPLLGELADLRGRLRLVVGDAVRLGPVAAARAIAFVSSCDLRGRLPAVEAPTLLVWGDRDRLVPSSIAAEWDRVLPRSRIVYVSCGHVPMLEAPERVADCILAFLGDHIEDDVGDEPRARVVNGVRLVGDDDQTAAR